MTSDSTDERARQIRHRVRGCLQGLKLCVAALETGDLTQAEALEFAADVERQAAKLAKLMDEVDEHICGVNPQRGAGKDGQ